MQIGIIGLGKMGSRMAKKLSLDNHEVFVWNRTPEDVEELVKTSNVNAVDTIENLVGNLTGPRIIWIMVTHHAVEEILIEVRRYISKGDVIIDGGNSFFHDTDRRYSELERDGIHFLGIGTSGGILAGENGYPFMVGGSRTGYDLIIPILDTLAKPAGGHQYFGIGGAGHFVKMVHNGIEYGIMQSLGEGFEVLNKADYKFNLLDIVNLWQKGTLVSGYMLDRTKEALEKGDVDSIVGKIAASGEAQWTVDEAREKGIDVEIIERSLDFRKRSENDPRIQNTFTAKLIAALRREFGGHIVTKLDSSSD